MIKDFILAIKIKELRKKILFILFIFGVFRLMANIPIPGIERGELKTFFQKFQMFGLLNLFTGGSLERISIVMLGLGPYITATIILQLLTLLIPSLEKMYKEGGREGREKFEEYGRILTVPICFLQAFAMLSLFSRQGLISKLSPLVLVNSIFTITAGSIFLMWLGELISEKKLGNGISLLIFAGIAADFSSNLGAFLFQFKPQFFFSYLLFLALAILIVFGVVFVDEAKRNIPVSYSKRVRGTRLFGGVSTYLPLSLNPAGVIPIIFAISLLTFPSTIASFFSGYEGKIGAISQQILFLFENSLFYGIFYFLLVFFFTFFYTAIVFDPNSISQNLQKFGGFIPGIRPGKPTSQYLSFVLKRLLLFGGLFLGLIAISPTLVQAITKISAFRFFVGGTSVLILVSVILETIKQLKSEIEMREYEI